MSDDRFVYMAREWAHGTYYPIRYQYRNGAGKGIGKYYETVFMGNESHVREQVKAGNLPDLPWSSIY